MIYRVLYLEAQATEKAAAKKGKKPAATAARVVGERVYCEPVNIKAVFGPDFIEGVDPRSQAEAAAQSWVFERSGRLAIVVVDIVQFHSIACIKSSHPPESTRRVAD